MKPGQSIEIQLEDNSGKDLPLRDVVVRLRLFTNGNFRYAFHVGLTDRCGHLSVSYDDVEGLRSENAHHFMMDYNTRLEDCDPQISVVVPSEPTLREQYDAVMRHFGTPPEWSNPWPANGALIVTDEVRAPLAEAVTEVRVRSQLVT